MGIKKAISFGNRNFKIENSAIKDLEILLNTRNWSKVRKFARNRLQEGLIPIGSDIKNKGVEEYMETPNEQFQFIIYFPNNNSMPTIQEVYSYKRLTQTYQQ